LNLSITNVHTKPPIKAIHPYLNNKGSISSTPLVFDISDSIKNRKIDAIKADSTLFEENIRYKFRFKENKLLS
jgi:hypothetical protein